MIDILFKIYFEAFYWEISLLSLGFSWSPCVGPEGVLCEVSSNRWSYTLRRTPPNLGNFISRVRRKNDPQYFYTLRRKSWCICTQALNKYYNKDSRWFKNATEPWLLLHSNEKCRTCCYCRHYIQFPLIRFSFGWTVWESLNDCVWIRGLASSK